MAAKLTLIQGGSKPPAHCSFCAVKRGEPHTEECRQNWRDTILSYGKRA